MDLVGQVPWAAVRASQSMPQLSGFAEVCERSVLSFPADNVSMCSDRAPRSIPPTCSRHLAPDSVRPQNQNRMSGREDTRTEGRGATGPTEPTLQRSAPRQAAARQLASNHNNLITRAHGTSRRDPFAVTAPLCGMANGTLAIVQMPAESRDDPRASAYLYLSDEDGRTGNAPPRRRRRRDAAERRVQRPHSAGAQTRPVAVDDDVRPWRASPGTGRDYRAIVDGTSIIHAPLYLFSQNLLKYLR